MRPILMVGHARRESPETRWCIVVDIGRNRFQEVRHADELWIVRRNAGRLTWYGANAKVQQLRLPSFYLRWETARDAGMLLYGVPKGRLGRVILT
jgi:hypothetical protein